MKPLEIKIILAIAIGILVGTVSGNLESNKELTYFHSAFEKEISKEAYDMYVKRFKDPNGNKDRLKTVLNKKVTFNKELGFYYGAMSRPEIAIHNKYPYGKT